MSSAKERSSHANPWPASLGGSSAGRIASEPVVVNRFSGISPEHHSFWDEMNEVEYERGYVREVYERPDSPALHQMELLTDNEFQMWLKKFEAISKKRRRKSCPKILKRRKNSGR